MFEDSRDKTIRELEREYIDTIDSIAREWIDEQGQDEDWLHESIDSHSAVIYTYQARIVLTVTDNPDAYAEDFGEGQSPTVEQQAYAAMMRDVHEQAAHIIGYRKDHPEMEEVA